MSGPLSQGDVSGPRAHTESTGCLNVLPFLKAWEHAFKGMRMASQLPIFCQENTNATIRFEKCITSDEVVFAQGFFVGV